jgi:4'-phosphopantetheinyl transferase EntD
MASFLSNRCSFGVHESSGEEREPPASGTLSALHPSGLKGPRVEVDVEAISRLFPADVAVCIASTDMYNGGLLPEEDELISAASPKRRAEFTAGRNAARAALACIGGRAQPILANVRRAPLWPTGFVGSITHCDEFCCAVVARFSEIASLGFDAETIDALEATIAEFVCLPDELAHFSTLPTLPKTNWPKLAFSAKEAFHKYYNPLTGHLLDFQDVSVQFHVGPSCCTGSFTIIVRDRPELRFQSLMHGVWFIDEKRVYAAASQRRA